MPAKKQRRKDTPGGADDLAGKTSRYLALHNTELARSLAAGALTSAVGIEQWAPLRFVGSRELAGALDAARRGRNYGVVALVEIAQERLGPIAGEGADAIPALPYVPLASISRIVFESEQDLEEFRARASGYQDVPVDVLPYQVEPGLFVANGMQQALDLPLNALPSLDATSGALPCVALVDKLAGAFAACLSASTRCHIGGPLATAFADACREGASYNTPGIFVRALATRLDSSPEAFVQATLAGEVANALAGMAQASGFDAERFLDKLGGLFEPGSSEAAFAAKFADWARAVLSGSHDVPDDGFANQPGKIVSRALLLFLLNPDALRIQAIGRRMGEIGSSVDVLASTLAGCLGGFASLPVALKASDAQRYLGVPLLACLLARGESPSLLATTSYRPDASADYALLLEGYTLLATRIPSPPHIVELRGTLAGLGFEAALEQASGHLAWHDPAAPGIQFRARSCETPVFPRRPAMELYATFDRPSAGGERPSDFAARSKDSGVFAHSTKKGGSRVMQLGVICDEPGPATVRAALHVLAGAIASAACSGVQ